MGACASHNVPAPVALVVQTPTPDESPYTISAKQIEDFFVKHGNLIVYGENMNSYIYHGAEAINRLGLWHWIKAFDSNQGFLQTQNSNALKISKQPEVEADDHSGITLVCTLKFLQWIAIELVEGDGPIELCSVCLSDEYNNTPPMHRTILECGHMYHRHCVESVYDKCKSKVCPLCRQNTLPDFKRIRERAEKNAVAPPRQRRGTPYLAHLLQLVVTDQN